MKKIIISVLIILLIILAYFTIFQGLSLGNFKILSVKAIISENDNLEMALAETNSLLRKDFPNQKEILSTEIAELLNKKEEYYNVAKISTEGEISKANTEEVYLIEYLWTRVGRHATSKGVNLKMDVNNGDTGEEEIKNLSFTMKGRYVGIIDFIYAIEDDSELNFKIENFKMVPDSEDSTNLVATFDVKNIRIKKENTTVSSTDTNTNTNNNENTIEGQNSVNTNTVTDSAEPNEGQATS